MLYILQPAFQAGLKQCVCDWAIRQRVETRAGPANGKAHRPFVPQGEQECLC